MNSEDYITNSETERISKVAVWFKTLPGSSQVISLKLEMKQVQNRIQR